MESSKQNLVFILGALCVIAWLFYQPQITNFGNSSFNYLDKLSTNAWNSSLGKLNESSANAFDSSVNSLQESSASALSAWNSSVNYLGALSTNIWNFLVDNLKKLFTTDKIQVVNNVDEEDNFVVDCDVTSAPDLNSPSLYENDKVLVCLGNHASSCWSAIGVLKDPFFPTIFEVMGDENNCSFKLSYASDSKLKDITGKNLAGQYVMCPISIVKAVNESKTPVFSSPSIDNYSKYASQIYFYGTIGLFLENDLDQDKIKNQGCSGPYIQTVIKSFQKAESGS